MLTQRKTFDLKRRHIIMHEKHFLVIIRQLMKVNWVLISIVTRLILIIYILLKIMRDSNQNNFDVNYNGLNALQNDFDGVA